MEKEIKLTPIRETTSDYDKIKDVILKIFREEIYYPLIAEVGFKKKMIQNSIDDLLNAIQSGQIFYSNGKFLGKFNAEISRELKRLGAEWDRKQGSWKIPPSKLTIEMRTAISMSESKFQVTLNRVAQKLNKIVPEDVANKVELRGLFDTTLSKVEKDFQSSIKGITIAPTVTPLQRDRIAAEYTNNLQLYINDFTQKEIVELRKNVQALALSGKRYDGLVDIIQKSYGVSQNKAKFLARQETSLMMTKYKQVRYQEAGSEEYIWRCVAGTAAHPVRPMHKMHDGKKFRWDSPPVVDEKGDRKNPGQDYNCRCTAIAVIKF